jgi:uncharacterized protein YcbK (DUF882 family)
MKKLLIVLPLLLVGCETLRSPDFKPVLEPVESTVADIKNLVLPSKDTRFPACFPSKLIEIIHEGENRFGKVTINSVHRRGARIAGTRDISQHALCKAVDFTPDVKRRKEWISYLTSRKNEFGCLGIYNSYPHKHLHIDSGVYSCIYYK